MAEPALYDEDVVAWSEQQAAALRALAEREPRLANAIDWANVIDEIETVGRSEVRSAASAARQIFIHLLKAFSDPGAPSEAHWRTETLAFLADFRADYTPAMRQRIDLDRVWRDARSIAESALAELGKTLAPAPETSPFGFDDLINRDFRFDAAVDAIRRAAGAGGTRA